jgi:hypothetical protein
MPEMSRVLKHVIETEAGDIGLDVYPIDSETHRAALNKLIIEHYYNREIAHESTSIFKFNLRKKMNEIMPAYNQLFLLQLTAIDLMMNVDVTTVATRDTTLDTESDTTSTSSSEGSGTTSMDSAENVAANSTANTENETKTAAKAYNSAFPQSQIVSSENYATSAQHNNSAANSGGSTSSDSSTDTTTGVNGTNTTSADGTSIESGSGKATTDEDVTSTTKGRQNVLGSDAFVKARATIINIEMMIVEDLGELFSLTWGGSDNYSEGYYQW